MFTSFFKCVNGAAFEIWTRDPFLTMEVLYHWAKAALACGAGGGIRTPEGECQQIYSLSCLTASLPQLN